MSPVPWRIVQLEVTEWRDDAHPRRLLYAATAEAPPEVVPAVWTHEGCEPCGGTAKVWTDHYEGTNHGGLLPCPDGRLVPWKDEEEHT